MLNKPVGMRFIIADSLTLLLYCIWGGGILSYLCRLEGIPSGGIMSREDFVRFPAYSAPPDPLACCPLSKNFFPLAAFSLEFHDFPLEKFLATPMSSLTNQHCWLLQGFRFKEKVDLRRLTRRSRSSPRKSASLARST